MVRKGKRIDVYVSNEQYEKIMDVCTSEGRTMSSVVRAALRLYTDNADYRKKLVSNYLSSTINKSAQKGDI